MLSFVKQMAETVANGSGCLAKVENPVKPVAYIFLDSFIVAGIAFFATWNGTLDTNSCLAALKGFGLALFGQLFYERGIKKAPAD